MTRKMPSFFFSLVEMKEQDDKQTIFLAPFVISLMQLLTYRDGTRKVISGILGEIV